MKYFALIDCEFYAHRSCIALKQLYCRENDVCKFYKQKDRSDVSKINEMFAAMDKAKLETT